MIDNIFRAILTTSLYASIVGLLIILVKILLKDKINSTWHYLIWVVLILKLMIPFGPESVFSLFNVVPSVPQQSSIQTYHQQVQQENGAIQNETSTAYISLEGKNTIAAKAVIKPQKILFYFWISGSALMLLWMMFTYYSLNKKLSKGIEIEAGRLKDVFTNCKIKMKIDRNIGLLLQETVETPSFFGIIFPKILLSPSISGFNDKQLEYILLHELAHYKRKDVLVNYLLLVFQIIHWFNPVLWYCFRCIRRDMETATDEKVLRVLDNSEHKEYGKALLAVLENFDSSGLAPKLIGMVDNKSNIEKRIRLIRMAQLFKRKQKLILVIGMLSVTMLGCVSLTNGVSKTNNNTSTASKEIQELYKYKTPYVGDSSKVSNIARRLAYSDLYKGISLKTDTKPYGVTVSYDFSKVNMDINSIEPTLSKNAAIMFSLIDNVDIVTFKIAGSSVQPEYEYKRVEVQKNFDRDLREYTKSLEVFSRFIDSFNFKVKVFPEKYTPLMSSVPGIRISVEYAGIVDRIRYSASSGTLFVSNNMSDRPRIMELPKDMFVYWSPTSEDIKGLTEKNSIITVTLLDKQGNTIGEKQVTINEEKDMFYTVGTAPGVVVDSNSSLNPELEQRK